jgi:ParB family transcriptional regulator, chromosome partitioning protein
MIHVPITAIIPNPYQPRSDFDPTAIDALCASIIKYGILEPLILREIENGRYEIIAGERRFRASKKAGLTEVPAIIRNSTDAEMLEIAMIENLHREDISAIDKAKGFRKLMEEFRYTQNQISKIMGMSRSAIANTIRLLDLPGKIQEALHRKEITEGHARAILSISDDRERDFALRRILGSQMSVREAEELSRVLEKHSRTNGRNGCITVFNNDESRLIEALQEKLGTKVHVVRSANGGRIEIEFYSDEDLNRIFEAI